VKDLEIRPLKGLLSICREGPSIVPARESAARGYPDTIEFTGITLVCKKEPSTGFCARTNFCTASPENEFPASPENKFELTSSSNEHSWIFVQPKIHECSLLDAVREGED
jgi:hypothetical protein